jgi:hypothetical protein
MLRNEYGGSYEKFLADFRTRIDGPKPGDLELLEVYAYAAAGNRDEYHLDSGAAAFRRAVASAGVPDDRVHFELFDGGHGGIEHRYPLSISWLSKILTD